MGNTNFNSALMNPDSSRVMVCGPITWGVKQGSDGRSRGTWSGGNHPDKMRVTTVCLSHNGREFAIGTSGGVLEEGLNEVWALALTVVDRGLAEDAVGKTVEATGIIEYPDYDGLPLEGAWNESLTLNGCN